MELPRPRALPDLGDREPGGPVTGYRGFLFCDLRGYTRFVERHGDHAAAELLDRYRGVVRRAVARFDGAEIRTEGDSFYVVFESASGAVLCGLTIGEAAAQTPGDAHSSAVPVAVGVHAGEALEGAEGFVGQAVNIAARVCAQAQAGEVLVTDTVRSLTRTTIAVRFDPRGRRRLKGIEEPIFLFAAAGPNVAMPPPRAFRGIGTPRMAVVAGATLLLVVAVIAGALAMSQPASAPDGGSAPNAAVPDPASVGQIAFTDLRTATVWLIAEDGSGRTRVPTNGAVTSAQISPGGRQLVYAWTDPGGGRGRIEVTTLDGQGASVPLSDDPAFSDSAPSWSPTELAVVFSRSRAEGRPTELWAMNYDGTQPVQMTAPQSESHELPSWSPDGTRIAFSIPGSGLTSIGADCTALAALGGVSAEDRGPVWSPDVSRVAFTGFTDALDASDVFVMNGAGRDTVNLTRHAATDRDPAWSPNGGRIAFVSNRSGDDEIWIMNADGSAPRQLTDRTGHEFGRLSWSGPIADMDGSSQAPGGPGLVPPAVNRPIGAACPAAAP